jgi:hypothetical protein
MNQQDNEDAEGRHQEEEDRFSVLPKSQKKSVGEKKNKRKDAVKRSKVQVPTTT